MKILSFVQLARDMGVRYVLFRFWYEIQRKSGLLKRRFPVNQPMLDFVSKEQWISDSPRFFFDIEKPDQFDGDFSILKKRVEALKENKLYCFHSTWLSLTAWHVNPVNGYAYDLRAHWTHISDFSTVAGDIKYVWEQSRFAFLYDLVRYDLHFKEDQSELVLSKIESWIHGNPVNCGPNWICSQEIALRVLNWTFALQYYKKSANLTEPRFHTILNSIYRQMQHVAENIEFSRIAVRNNHALTETLSLYLIGLLFPFFPESAQWKGKGKKWFEEEIAYQIDDEGAYLQFSMNYHRVVVQLLTWAIRLAELNEEKWKPIVYERARKSIYFLTSCQDEITGWLPHYGNNDGALFFPLTDCHYRDFRPQLYALSTLLEGDLYYGAGIWQEEAYWIGKVFGNVESKGMVVNHTPQVTAFPKSGYLVIRDRQTVTFLRCGKYRTRPFQADHLHLDIWADGENILHDAGTYLYNTKKNWIDYFSGTAAHNTVMLGDYDQMRKGPGFIWFDWIKKSQASYEVEADAVILEAEFEGFRRAGKGIVHQRKVTKIPGQLHWTIEDWIRQAPVQLPMHQIWHPGHTFSERFVIQAFGSDGAEIFPQHTAGWYAESYGVKVPVGRPVFSSSGRYIKTVIKPKGYA